MPASEKVETDQALPETVDSADMNGQTSQQTIDTNNIDSQAGPVVYQFEKIDGLKFDYSQRGVDWADQWSQCAGEMQSPIDLTRTGYTDVVGMEITGKDFQNYYGRETYISQAGIAQDMSDLGEINLILGNLTKSGPYHPSYAVFKSPSEHCFDKVRYDLEMQVIFKKEGETNPSAAIALFWDRKKAANKFCPFLARIRPEIASYEGGITYDVIYKSFLSTVNWQYFWSYEGSLTTPPCTEGI